MVHVVLHEHASLQVLAFPDFLTWNRVIADGAVQAVGTHDALLEAGGLYASLVRKQLAGSAASSSASLRAVPSSPSLMQPFSPSL